jgi:hypothetical protein
MASLVAGVIVKTNKATHQLSNYNWVGYLSIAVLIVAVLIGNKIFKQLIKLRDSFCDQQPLKSNELQLDIIE